VPVTHQEVHDYQRSTSAAARSEKNAPRPLKSDAEKPCAAALRRIADRGLVKYQCPDCLLAQLRAEIAPQRSEFNTRDEPAITGFEVELQRRLRGQRPASVTLWDF
jgi:hypothetical protein